MPNTELIGPIPTGRGLERVALWVIGTRTEAERQELRAEPDHVVRVDLSGPNSCLEPETGRPDVMGSESNDWLACTSIFQLDRVVLGVPNLKSADRQS
jgi:hypothetical protein